MGGGEGGGDRREGEDGKRKGGVGGEEGRGEEDMEGRQRSSAKAHC